MSQFLRDEYNQHRERYPDGIPNWARVVDYVIDHGKSRCVKIKCWIWIDRVYGAHTKYSVVICDWMKYADGLFVDYMMEKCWCKASIACKDPSISVCATFLRLCVV